VLTHMDMQAANSSRFRKYMRLDATLFIASMVGAFTLSGFAYLEKYYLTLDVSIERLNVSAQEILAYGAARFGSYLGAVAFAMALIGMVTVLLLLFDKPKQDADEPQMPKWLAHVRRQAICNRGISLFVAALCVIACLLILAWFLLIRWPSNDGRTFALKQALECVERRLVYENLDHYMGCQVAESDDMLYLIQRKACSQFGVEFKTLELPKQGIKSITTAAQFYPYERPEGSGCVSH
jgi:NADH:ubiquinone oxidoreductase subunit 5 (subunit L)/multisubunit Na+/H+ antiporter MnhA subunit